MNFIECKNCKAINYQGNFTCHSCKKELFKTTSFFTVDTNEIEKQQRVQEDDYNATVDIYKELEIGIKLKKQESLLELYKQITHLWERRYDYVNSVDEREKIWKIIKELEK